VLKVEEDLGDITRSLVTYQVEEGCRVFAYVVRPKGEGPFPGVVVFHPTTNDTILQPAGLAEPPEKHFGVRLAEQGYVTVSPRNVLWDYRGRPSPGANFAEFEVLVKDVLLGRYPQWTGMGKMLWDGLRATDYLLTLPGVDADRLGCVGHSLGAKEVLYALAFDERMKAGVSSEGGIGLPFTNWTAPWYLGEGITQRPDLEHHQLLALAAPRALLVLGGGAQPPAPDARAGAADFVQDWSYLEAARPAYALHGKTENLGFLLHDAGHWVPPVAQDALYGWLHRHLG
jgi:dienelactone hydrolase